MHVNSLNGKLYATTAPDTACPSIMMNVNEIDAMSDQTTSAVSNIDYWTVVGSSLYMER